VEETLPADILGKMGAPPKKEYPTITPDVLATYDAILFGVPTRYGNMSAQWKACLIFDLRHATCLPYLDILGRNWQALGRWQARR